MNIDCTTLKPIKIKSLTDPLNCLMYKIKKMNNSKLDITIDIGDFYSTELNGIYLKFLIALDTYRISILINSRIENACWERYVGAKELAHILVGDDPSTWTEDVPALLSELSDENINILNSSNKDVLETEIITPIIAVELLSPYCYNHIILDTSKTSLEVAKLLKVPERMIDILRNSDYQSLRVSTYSNL
jgi:Zn-dependent peptidase ImmA (M78 family)